MRNNKINQRVRKRFYFTKEQVDKISDIADATSLSWNDAINHHVVEPDVIGAA